MITKEIRNLLGHTATLLTRIAREDYQEIAIAITQMLEEYPEPKFSIGDIVVCDDFEDKNENLPWKIEEMYLTKAGEWRYWGDGYWANIWCSESDLELVKRKGESK